MIEKITDQNLERYDSRLKEWCDRKFFEKGNYGKYETTEEAGAVTFYPAPNTPLEGKVKFSFKETMPANGDKSPDNPSTITGVSSIKVTRCGKNLCPLVNVAVPNVSTTGVTVLVDAVSGSISISGKATASDTISFVPALVTNFLAYNTLRAGKTYTFSLSGNTPSSGFKLRLFVTTTSSSSWSSDKINVTTNNSSTYTLPNDIVTAWLRIDISQDTDFGTGCTFTVQVEEGETASEFEPYFENEYPLPLGSTYYGGTLDVASGVMTVTRGICIANGTTVSSMNTIGTIGDDFRHNISFVASNLPKAAQATPTNQVSTHFSYSGSLSANFGNMVIISNYIVINDKNGLYSTNESFNEWLSEQYNAGTPVTFAYTLLTPFTVQLTPQQILSLSQTDKYTPRLNTVYTDADSIQISYLKSPIRDEYEKTQAILSLGGNS